MKIGIIDYGVGNLGSVMRAIEALRVTPVLVDRATDMHTVDRLLLPGVGNFADCAQLLHKGGWADALCEEVQHRGKHLLGVCVGMQLLATSSMEGAQSDDQGTTPGLNLIPGKVEHLSSLGCTLRVPHSGWNNVSVSAAERELFDGIPDGTDFYFVHSYAFTPEDSADILAVTDYGVPVVAAVRRGRVWGTQFHPEKSSRAGFRLLRNFVEAPEC
ncbi:imidazole glycerol phosphate synthase subunit HisH [Pseudomonas chlororaphis]|uniref:imidazole glycerol phosphate synthase subunit HisH n=1 Tax=Pseudomonas chlororaphis TaxID=587753 RepID=UPI00209AEE48|nr:imidazole glycerol phosphate synthase subunit HisH [Pseudomonas chlororaphis]MCO7570713.1 imidazole glycerol phosphate synthase subunit HisH [Pseudomonas chlororaphis]MCO7588767.1 imidazole glycerol phosphate synthase subunit HisH [Pseudomonas chlororaphis]MCO7611928.1 imidazole glycerol phosphate synthase subunit HisH [Pseudomonas chlororaphis]